jgi:O-6-methylguanine DNA methyltransferase
MPRSALASRDLIFRAGETAFGWVGVAETDAGIRRMTLPAPSRAEALRHLADDFGPAPVADDPDATDTTFIRLRAYLDGAAPTLDLPIDPGAGTPFQRAVWDATRRIPHGETRSYKWVAEEIGKPTAYRAVGQALGANPLALLVPCHRVIGSDGGLTGFGGPGIEMKRRLLALEKPHP